MTDVTFRLHAPAPPPDTYLRVVGGHPALGGWSPATAPGLVAPAADGGSDGDGATAAVTVSLPPGEAVEYKYARVDAAAGTVTWEGGDNRRLEVAAGAVAHDHWAGGESPTLPCDGIVVPPSPAAGTTGAPAAAEEAAAAPPAADAAAAPADAPAPSADAPASSTGALASSAGAPASSTDALAPSSDAPAPPADAPAPTPAAAAAAADAHDAPAADDTTALGVDAPADAGGDGAGGDGDGGDGGDGEPAAKGGGDANIFKHLSSGVSSLLRAISRGDGGRGRRDEAGPPPANGLAQTES